MLSVVYLDKQKKKYLIDCGVNGSSVNYILIFTMSEIEQFKAFKRIIFAPAASKLQTSHWRVLYDSCTNSNYFREQYQVVRL